MLEIGPGTKVKLNFAVRLDSGEVIDTNMDKPPVTFEVGDESLPFGFEKQLFGRVAGDHVILDVPAADGFGPHNADNVQKLKIEQFRDVAPEPGMILGFSDPAQGEVPGLVVEVGSEYVTVDFNHPLAGRDLKFEVRIHSIEPVR